MSRSLLLWVVLGIIGFALVLLVRLPSRWVSPLLPDGVHCQTMSGTVWRGHCAQLQLPDTESANTLQVDGLGWQLHPLALLRGRVDADVQLSHRGGSLQGHVIAASGGSVQVDDLSGGLPLDRSLLTVLPPGWTADASATAVGFGLRGATLESLQGVAQLRNLKDAQGNSFGSFEVRFADAPQQPPITGELHDLEGSLGVAGTVRIEANGAWQINGRLTPRAQTPPALVQQLRVLGLPDASGAYPFSIAGLLE